MKSTHSLIAAGLLLSAATLYAADAIELKQQWIVGKKYFQTMETASTTTMSMGGQDMDQKINMTMEFSTAISPYEGGPRKRLTVRYGRMAMKMDMMGQETAFDSANPDDDPQGIGKDFSAIVGKELKMLTSERDEIQEIENLDEFKEGMTGKMFTKESLSELAGQASLKSMPGHSIKPGDSWPVSYSIKLPQIGTVSIKGNYTFTGMNPHDGIPCAEITMDASMEIAAAPEGAEKDPTAGMMQAMGVTLTHGKITGTTWFDPALGMSIDVRMKQEMEMSMKNPTKPDETIKIPTKQDISIKLTKVEDLK